MMVKHSGLNEEYGESAGLSLSPGTARATRRKLAAHHKVVLLGTSLLFACAMVAAIGIGGVTSIEAQLTRLARRDSPALALLLQIDRDLYQAQLGLERALTTTAVEPHDAAVAFYVENLGDSDRRFAAFKLLAGRAKGEAALIAEYETARWNWMRTADELVHAPLAAKAPADQALANFDAMRQHLNRIVDEIYQPSIEASGDFADRYAQQTRWKLYGGVALALLAGIAITANMARHLRAQLRAAQAGAAERETQNTLQRFETRLTRGLEMMQDETTTLSLVEEVIRIAAPAVTAEVLLADSSRAHLLRAAATDRERKGCGCTVAKPGDCPAVRRGHRLNFQDGSVFDACPHLRNRAGGPVSAVCIPLSIMGQTVGVLHATAANGQLPPEDQIRALEQVASKSGERLGLLRAFRKTEAQASSDPLTGLMNRRSLEEKVHELTSQNAPYTIAYGDLDHFKNLNDTYGHETGDKALRMFAQVLKSSVRPGDLPARWGGEEFVLVLPNATPDEAVIVLDRVRRALASALQSAVTPTFTVSFGVAEKGEGQLFVDVLARADESLLRAKKEGRNRTIKSPHAEREPNPTASDPTDHPLPAAAAA